jgi:CrcB protein
MKLALLVGLFGGVGSLARYLLSVAVQRQAGATFPVGTLVVNVAGSLAMGLVVGIFAARGAEGSSWRVAMTTGFMGGFTTFSAFAYETWVLLERRSFVAAGLNVGATLTVCVLGCAGGLWLGRTLGRP